MAVLTDPMAVSSVGQQVLATVLGISTTTINKLEREGVFVKQSRGRYDLTQAVRAYIVYRLSGFTVKAESERAKLIRQQR